jgi:hypothetical protein
MSLEQTRFTIMALPQNVDEDGILSLNIVFIPRNINPLEEFQTDYGFGNKAKAFVNIQPQFDIKIVNNPDEFPGNTPVDEKSMNPVSPFVYSSNMEDIYKTLLTAKDEQGNPKYFDIQDDRSNGRIGQPPNSSYRAPSPTSQRDIAIRKYLPVTYRKAFNFTSPRVKNAVTDDSYYCSFRKQAPPKEIEIDNKVSWGKVYAHLMRQPFMAKQAGLIYETKISLEEGDFKKGGWIYVDIKKGTDYYVEQNKSLTTVGADPFIKRYAARIPVLEKNEARSLFAAVLFPVMKENEPPVGIYDELFIEAARFNEGFATIVHSNQPVSGNILSEEQDGFHPQKELGIRLGWEDEQILIWYLRQLTVDESTGASMERLDAPLGVAGYHIDVRKITENGPGEWESLNHVKSNGNMVLEGIIMDEYDGELPYQVYPIKTYDDDPSRVNHNYWLPMYFANWNNASIVLPDKTAARIYHSDEDDKYPVKISDTYRAIETEAKLEYGSEYQFRVRLSDLSGGYPDLWTPSPDILPISHIGNTLFKRYVVPNKVIIENEIVSDTDGPNFNGDSLTLSRPLLGYPAAVYTGKYENAVGRLADAVQYLIDNKVGKAYGIPDPDVCCVEIKVEVETLKMDNLASEDGRENYITLFKTYRAFENFDEDAPEGTIEVPIAFKDVNVLNLTDTDAPFSTQADNDFIARTEGGILLPTARNIRLTLRAVGEEKDNYWGHENLIDRNLDSRYGKPTVIRMRQESVEERKIFADTENPTALQGIYLQPDPYMLKLDPIEFKKMQGGSEGMSDIVHRLGNQLGLEVKELTLTSRNGKCLQIWCSNMLRHSLAPDNSSITFANKNELQDHWLVCTSFTIDRDWSWDSLNASSFDILRKRNNGKFKQIGDLELKRIACYQAIQPDSDGRINREYTKIILIDVVDTKPVENNFPDIIELQYEIDAKFRSGHNPESGARDRLFRTKSITLPTTINPYQTPKLIAAGVALTPYNRNKEYSYTKARTRFLWLEFAEKPKDENDELFCRVLAYSHDQLISNNHPSLMDIPVEPPVPLDPEYIRVIAPESSQDNSGLNAMQKLEKSNDQNHHFYLLPLPPGLHHESPELFGMFTYEFRYGHTDKIWSTAQGRFGRALRVSGLQHPAPTLTCMVNRNEKAITVNAPYAKAVFNGKNVTASPPHTSLWALLYAQVKQVDGLDYRNILLNEMELEPLPKRNVKELYYDIRRSLEEKNEINKAKKLPAIEITNELINQIISQQVAWEKESSKQAFGQWTNREVRELLNRYGLPINSSLSVICLEVFGQITNAFEHIDNFENYKEEFVDKISVVFNSDISSELKSNLEKIQSPSAIKRIDPLNSQLGKFRFLRTSPLTEVPYICPT